MSTTKRVLITDLDNTLFDWVELWVRCFSAMLEEMLAISGVPKNQLLPEIAAVHQKHGTSEYSFLIEELPSLQKFLAGRNALEIFAPAINAFREKRTEYLVLYPGVAETLQELKQRGTLIVGYTESMAFYSNYRVRNLGLDGVFDYIFCPEDHIVPDGVEEIRRYPAEHYSLKYTIQHHTPKGSKKPDVDVLQWIMSDLSLMSSECVYIGDSLMKDIAMANDCGIDSVWAKYGVAHKRDEYKLLQEVTHWTPAEVAREQKIRERDDVLPKFVLKSDFSELLSIFDFESFAKTRG
ncbi:HAD family hydrolase [Pseudomonas koreensis]